MRRRLLAVGCAALAVIALAGCTPGHRPADHPTAGGGSARSSATPSETPSPTPTTAAEDPLDPSTWLISAQGIGPARLGQPVAGIVSQLTEYQVPADAASTCFNTAITFLAPPGGSVSTAPLLLAANPDGTLYAVALSATGPKTAEGIGFGSSLASVTATYPGAAESLRANSVNQYTVQGTPGWITFQDDGASGVGLVSVVTGNVPPYEYCG